MMSDFLSKAGRAADQFLHLPILEQVAYVAKALFDVFILILKGLTIIAIIGAVMVTALMIRELAYELKNRRKKK